MTFIVQIFVDEGGAIRGVVEQVRTGRKEPIRAIEDIRRVFSVLVAAERAVGRRYRRCADQPGGRM